jgi:hypothetical protein
VTSYGTIAGSHSSVDPAVELVLREFTRDKMYGSVEIKFEAGRVVLVRRTESIKPANLNNREEGSD